MNNLGFYELKTFTEKNKQKSLDYIVEYNEFDENYYKVIFKSKAFKKSKKRINHKSRLNINN